MADGSVCQLESSWTVHSERHAGIEAELAVVGLQRTARLQGADLALWPMADERVGGALRNELADFCPCVRQGKPSSVASLDTAVEALRVAEAVIEAGRTGAVVHLNPRAGL